MYFQMPNQYMYVAEQLIAFAIESDFVSPNEVGQDVLMFNLKKWKNAIYRPDPEPEPKSNL